ncbi:MAG: response regulator [Candidatus Omnitrophota bacterium]
MNTSRKRILIVDDEKEICSIVKEGLEKIGGFAVDVAHNGKDGIRIAKNAKPDLILLDIRMPGMDGIEVLKRLKEDRATMEIPVVMLTAVADDEVRVKSAELFDEEYITKPAGLPEIKKGSRKSSSAADSCNSVYGVRFTVNG